MTESTLTLTQSGLLAELLERQHHKLIRLAWRRSHREHMRAAFWSTFAWPRRACTAPTLVHEAAKPVVGTVSRGTLESLAKPVPTPHPIHTYIELKQQIHDDLRIQHPEWIESNGECPTCDSYESRLAELLDTFARTGSNESVAAIHRALEQGPN